MTMTASPPDTRELSFWHETVDAIHPPPLDQDIEVDVAIVGAGFTGLWTAYYLKNLDPTLSVAIVEAHFPGFGASGRNGGWCLGEMAGTATYFGDPATREPGIRLQRAIFETVDEVGRVVAQEGIDCHWAKGGMLNLATAPAHEAILHAEVAHWAELGFGEKDWLWLDRDAVTEHIRSPRVSAALYSPHCAAIHPLRLATGLAKVVQGLGVEIYGDTPATRIEKGSVLTPRGRVRADRVVLATEAYTDSIAGRKRQMLALHSMMIATEPLSAQTWEEIGLGARQTFGDPRRTVIYGQRTADDRIAFGTRGGYFFGSRTRSRFAPDERFFIQARKNLMELFPVLEDAEVTHSWGGALGVPRSWRPSVGMDRRAGLAWAGGYVGEGVAASNLGGRSVADLILERNSPLVELPWVSAGFEKWEPEPLRWLGAMAMDALGERLDRAEFAGRRPPRVLNSLYDWIVRK